MRIQKLYSLVLVMTVGLLLLGCAPRYSITGATDLDKSAFGEKKRFAVVSISSHKTIAGDKGLTGLFKNADEIPGANTQPLIDQLSPKIISVLGESRHFNLVPANTVLSSNAYKNIDEDERIMKILFTKNQINVAPDYKYISNSEKYAQLAKELGVDGVIGITATFAVVSDKGWLSINGLTLGKKNYRATSGVSAVAYNRDGKEIWSDVAVKEAEPGDSKAILLIDISDFSSADMMKLHPSFLSIGDKAVNALLARFDDTMAGKKVSKVQNPRN